MPPKTGFSREELYISPSWVILALITLSVLCGMYTITHPELPVLAELIIVCLLGIAGLGWLLSRFHAWASALFLVIGISVITFFLLAWFQVPGTLTLLSIPVWLAMAMAGWQAAMGIGLANSLLIFILSGQKILPMETSEIWLSLFSIWFALGVVAAVHFPIRQTARWTWEYYETARTHLAEARDRQSQLAQALDDLVHANRQLALLNERIGNYRHADEEARRSKEMFVARVSHEFRAPLNIIIGMVNLMVDSAHSYATPLPALAMRHLEVVNRSCRHLASMIDDVLDLSQAEGGRMVLHREMVNLIEVVDSALSIVRPMLENKGLGLQVGYPESLPLISCDRLRIRQVILNLLSNAARYTDKGAVSVEVSLETRDVVIRIVDTGPGIAPEDAERVFEAFSPVGKQNRWIPGGSGLGLSISKQFVELHDGTIGLESQLGRGSTFWVRLPLVTPALPDARPGQWISDQWIWMERHPGSERYEVVFKPRVIICDETGFLYPALLHQKDVFELVSTSTLDQAFAELQKAPASSLVLNLPYLGDLGGTLDRLRKEAPETPVVCTGFPRRIDDAKQAGADGFILKPLTNLGLDRTLDLLDREFRSILVVDDDEDTRWMMAELIHLYEAEIEVLLAEDGEEALRFMRDHLPDLVLLDVVMPGMSGWEVLALKQQDASLKDIPVIMVSAQDMHTGSITSPFLLSSIGDGVSTNKLVESLSFLPKLMLRPG